MSSKISMKQMLEAGVHFGHRTYAWNPQMAPYIYGERERVHIINLEHTYRRLMEALNFIGQLASRKGRVLFVGTKPTASEVIRMQAERCGMPYVDHRWLGGMLTNYKTVRQSIKRLKELETLRDTGALGRMIKKEALQLTRELSKLEQSLGGIKDMGGLPDALFIIDVGFEKIAVAEAKRLHIPIVGIVDTNNSPDGIDYSVPGNDDSVRAINLYATAVADCILDAKSVAIQPADSAQETQKAEIDVDPALVNLQANPEVAPKTE